MSEENFSTLIPQHSESPEIMRAKHAKAAALLVEPEAAAVAVVEIFPAGFGMAADWNSVVNVPTYFRKALIWGATKEGLPNSISMQIRHGSNANRVLNPGEMIVIEAMPGQKLDLRDIYAPAIYSGDALTFELYA